MSETQWLVIETQYPTEYGCYRGRQWTRLDLIRRSDVSVHGPFTSYEAAIADAKERAESDCHFEGCDFEEFWPGEPPYDSSDAENLDNDEEIRFEVMTRAEHDSANSADRSYAALACGKLNFNAALKRNILAAQVRSAKRTYYSCRPDPDLDIPAELEVIEKLSGDGAGAFLTLKGQEQDVAGTDDLAAGKHPSTDGDAVALALGDRVVVQGLKSAAQYNGRCGHVRGSLSEGGRHAIALEKLDGAPAVNIDTRPENLSPAMGHAAAPVGAANASTLRFDAAEVVRRRAPPAGAAVAPQKSSPAGPPPEDALAALCRAMPALREIHYFGRDLSEERVRATLAAAPHLARQLTVLRCAGGCELSPETLAALSGFKALERLDISNCVSCGFCDDQGYDSDGRDGSTKPKTYDAALEAVVKAAPQLAQLDFGYGDESMTRYFWDYCVSEKCVNKLQRAYPRLELTMSDSNDPIPQPFCGGDAEQEQAMFEAITVLASDEDEGIRANAAKALRGDDDDDDDMDGDD